MIFESYDNPSLEEGYNIIESALRKKAMIHIYSGCTAYYDGRAMSQLAYGERLILIKSDGAFMIHQNYKLDPINWQPPKSRTQVSIKEDKLCLESHRRSPPEKLEVLLYKIRNITYTLLEDYEDLEKVGLEEDMRQMILKHPDLIEKGFRPTSTEYSVESGFIDILGKDKNGTLMILELKSRRAGTTAVKQIRRYLKDFSDSKEKIRGILVAPSIGEDAKELLEEEGIEFKELKPPNELKSTKKITLDLF